VGWAWVVMLHYATTYTYAMQCCGAWEVEGVGWLPTLLWIAMGWLGKWWWGVGLVVCYIVGEGMGMLGKW